MSTGLQSWVDSTTPDVKKIITAWFNGAKLTAAWSAAGKPVTWGQLQRITKAMREDREERQRRPARKRQRDDDDGGDDDVADDAAAPAAAAASASSGKRKREPPSTQEKAPAAAPPGGSARTGAIKPAIIRRTSAQVSKMRDVEMEYRTEYLKAHKAAQAEYLAAREARTHRKKGSRVSSLLGLHVS